MVGGAQRKVGGAKERLPWVRRGVANVKKCVATTRHGRDWREKKNRSVKNCGAKF